MSDVSMPGVAITVFPIVPEPAPIIEQGTPEWMQLRLGKVTASVIADITAKTKSGYSSSRANVMAAVICERLTGQNRESYTNQAMQWGKDNEPKARARYTFETDNDVVLVPFVDHPTIRMSGCSPDGYVGARGLVEIKCPNSATHIDTLLMQAADTRYIKQMQWQMACTDRSFCDFVSYDPRLPPSMQYFKKTVLRDQKMIDELEKEVLSFLKELEDKERQLRKLYPAN